MKSRINNYFLMIAMVLTLLLSSFGAHADNIEGKYILSFDDTGEIIGTYDKLSGITNRLIPSDLKYGNYTITLTEDDPDMGNAVILPGGYQLTLRSTPGEQYRIGTKESSDGSQYARHFHPVYGDLILEDIILDGAGANGGVFLWNSSRGNGSLTMRKGSVIENVVANSTIQASPVFAYGDNKITIDGGIIRNNTMQRGGGAISTTKGNLEIVMNSGEIYGNVGLGEHGGGIRILDGTFIMNGGTIRDNTTEQVGGGVMIGPDVDRAEFNGGTISNNKSQNGGGVYIYENNSSLDVSFKNIEILNNESTNNGGGIYAGKNATISIENSIIKENKSSQGGAIRTNSPISIEDSTISDNSASGSGGALYLGDMISGNTDDIVRSLFDNNTARFGGAIYKSGTYLDINDGTFNNNKSGNDGGAIYADNDSLFSIRGTTEFTENYAEKTGGAIFTSDYDYGRIIALKAYDDIVVDNTTIFDKNIAGKGLFKVPDNAKELVHLQFETTSFDSPHILNNYDVNFAYDQYKSDLFEINYDANGGVGSFSETIAQTDQYQVKDGLETLIEKENYTLNGWEDSEGKLYQIGEIIQLNKNMTLYAQWTIDRFSVTYDSMGGTNVPDQTVDYMSVFTEPEEPSKEGYIFAGWYLDTKDDMEYDFDTPATEDIKLFSKWIDEEYLIEDKEESIDNSDDLEEVTQSKDSSDTLPNTGMGINYQAYFGVAIVVAGLVIVYFKIRNDKKKK